MPDIRNVADIIEAAAARKKKWRISVAAPYEVALVQALDNARSTGIAKAVLFGDRARIKEACVKAGVTIGQDFTVVHSGSDAEAIAASVQAVHEGPADFIIKGLVPTSALLRAVLEKESGLRSGRLLSHVAVFDEPTGGRLMLLTDAGINIKPNVHRKLEIVKNAVAVAKAIGIVNPRVAMLAAVDTLNYPAMPATLEAALVSRIASSGIIPDAVVEGPFSLDDAVSSHAAETKSAKGAVAGRADILCAPEIETANVLYKALQIFSKVTFASVVVGARKPLAVPSRSDTAESKLASIALACLLCG
jgi:phosphate butyryltransferase